MCKSVLWTLLLLVLVLPWSCAMILAWVYTEAFEAEPQDPTQPKVGWIVAIVQTSSGLLYSTYILLLVLLIGMVGRKSMCSFCCLVAGIPVFVVAPLVVGGAILSTSLSSSGGGGEESGSVKARDVGVAAGVCCLLSTAVCIFLLCWAIICGSKGRARNHRYPIPLAYFPWIRDFEEIEKKDREERDIAEMYTADYPPPFSEYRKKEVLHP